MIVATLTKRIGAVDWVATAADLNGAPSAGARGLNVETIGPITLLPHGRTCGIRFEADATVTIMLGMRDYGRGYASPYFASLLVARLGIPFKRVRLYYTGVLPAVRSAPRQGPDVPTRANVGMAIAEIGNLIETLCDRAIEQGRRFLASSIGVLPADIDFEASSGRSIGRARSCRRARPRRIVGPQRAAHAQPTKPEVPPWPLPTTRSC